MTPAEKWVRDEIGAMYSQCAGNINVPETALSRLVEKRDSLTAQLAAAQKRCEELRELLKRCEWTASAFMGQPICPICGGWLATHKSNCPLAAALKEGE